MPDQPLFIRSTTVLCCNEYLRFAEAPVAAVPVPAYPVVPRLVYPVVHHPRWPARVLLPTPTRGYQLPRPIHPRHVHCHLYPPELLYLGNFGEFSPQATCPDRFYQLCHHGV